MANSGKRDVAQNARSDSEAVPDYLEEATSLTLSHLWETECLPAKQVFSRLGDKWSLMIVACLADRSMRFGEIKGQLDGISQKVLTSALRGLERDGIVHRAVFAVVPPRVDYRLTPLGRELLVPVEALGAWVMTNRARIASAQSAYDAAHHER